MVSPSADAVSAGSSFLFDRPAASRRPSPTPAMGDRGGAGALVLFLVVIVLYLATYSTVPTSDGYTWIAQIDGGDPEKMLPAYHALPMFLLFQLKRCLAGLGIAVATLPLVQAVNAALAASGAVLLYGTVRVLGGGFVLAFVGGCLLASSFGSWYFANGELHHFAPVVLQLIFLLLVRARVKGQPCGYGLLAVLGLCNALAVMLHQESFLFGFAAVAVVLTGRPWRRALPEAAVYAIAGSLGTAVLALAIGAFLRGVTTPEELLRWFFWLFYASGEPQPYVLGNPAAAALRALKGQLVALTFGTQVVSDVAKEPALLRSSIVGLLLGATAVTYGMLLVLLIGLWRGRRAAQERLVIAGVGCVVWILSYKVLLHSWFWPTAPEYHVITLSPLILLVLLGPMAAKTGSAHRPRFLRWLAAAPIVVLVLVAAVNFQAGIRPWYRYGEMKQALVARLGAGARPDAFFISSESGIDSVLLTEGNHLSVKDVFRRSPREEGLAAIGDAIDEHLARGPVFVYNLVPGPFTLLGMNQAAARRGEAPLRRQDFEAFAAGLEDRYAFSPVVAYWEEGLDPLYLLGERSRFVWEVKRRSDR